ncbi:ATP/GTP-binding protein [Mycoplasmopsis canis UFG1]|uniref:tRNA threonylcarbamoyladenosine biosynthesis protein TsaE n=1 Tax=Mycoplasmopsis canis TaxID=29555 RepID=A0A0F6X1M3_9BACT|nr:tRNA (adenosine(37)-N6)-threonylcarbamoyltransferase complex ATPase subunit type 1 TsaE [Mycoplasmopsis canis]AKF40852.1 ATPase [Mycoplasmopsis canis]AMD80967.1 tRNA threonylcarbamoyladenosine biosynthesis protein TsaE [Mycoplasmopsis canis PG 14]EIE41091.1 ATP/GTP-binding protein [Mycoplasmopsis canis PG 14]EIE42279.1 ATP/GTP-binding protein [Mycoplasmopsis canis UFG1]VEU68569.1 ATP/GTP-binding protein [Mycoplasmopsis canis]
MKEYTLIKESELFNVINEWLPTINQIKKIYLIGDLGSGKTSFVKELAKQIGIKDKITSPSFNYMKNYNGLVHIDLYNFRGDIDEFEDFFEDNIIAFEWADLAKLPYKSYILINCKLNIDNSHTYRIEKF